MTKVKSLIAVSAVCLILAGCQTSIPWIQGKTFGTDVSITQPHIDPVIYRAPRKALFDAACNASTATCNNKLIEDLLWNVGKPPVFSVCLLGICYSNSVIQEHWYYWVYGNLPGWDWGGVIYNAQMSTSCPMVRWIPGVYSTRGWTTGEGCKIGSLS